MSPAGLSGPVSPGRVPGVCCPGRRPVHDRGAAGLRAAAHRAGTPARVCLPPHDTHHPHL